jgi:hypothetical protein
MHFVCRCVGLSGANDDPSESLRNGFNNLKAKWDDWEPEKR